MNTPTKITTGSWDALNRVGGKEYADTHSNKAYSATITKDGWAYIDNAKFAPNTFVVDNSNQS